jgi:hypothetical protein
MQFKGNKPYREIHLLTKFGTEHIVNSNDIVKKLSIARNAVSHWIANRFRAKD